MTTQPAGQQHQAGVTIRERYGLVALLLLGGYLLTGLGDSALARLAYAGVFVLILVVVVWAPGIPGWLRSLGAAFTLAFAGLVVIVAVSESEDAFGITLLILALLQGAAAAAILYRIARHDRVQFQVVFGAIAVYAMIGFAMASLYRGLDILQDGALFDGITDDGDYLYFALITLTTVGYGDVTPMADISKRLAEVEAFVGQIFLITLVARLVSMWGKPLRASQNDPGDSDETLADETSTP